MSNEVYDLKWGHEFASRIIATSEVGRIRTDPPLIPVAAGASRYEGVVPDLRVHLGPPISIRPSAKLAPIRISCHFALAQQQFPDEPLACRLALRPAADLAYAEDAILLHGARASSVLTALNIKDDDATLGDQEGLFLTAPTALAASKAITDSIREALEALRMNQQHGPYCVVVSPDLHREALTPLGTSSTPRIAPILPELRQQGFRFSEAAPPRTGVAFSLGGAALDIVVPWDTHVECRRVEGDALFAVAEQFRLRINDPRAVVTLS